MRALVIEPGPAFSVSDVCRGWVKGLRACGVDVALFNLGDRLNFYTAAHVKKGRRWVAAFPEQGAMRLAAAGIETTCYRWWPDVVIVISGFFIPPETFDIMRDRKHKVVLVHTESPYEDDRQLAEAAHADVNIVNDPTNLDRFRELGPAWYQPHCYDPELHHPGTGPDSDFFLCGTGYPSRVAWLERVDWTGVDARLAGNWQCLGDDSPLRPFLVHPIDECMPSEEAAEWYRGTRSSVNLYRVEAERPELAQGWSMGPREVELAACGTFFLRDSRGESDEVLPMLPAVTTPDEFGDLLRWWLAHPAEREEAAAKARDAVADRTFDRAAARLLDHLHQT